MTTTSPVLTGLLVGVSVAAPIGPMGILCIQRTLAGGMRQGVGTGLGAALMNVAYATVVIVFYEQAAAWVAQQARLVALCSGVFLLWSAVRLWRRRGVRAVAGGAAPGLASACLSAAMLNATNPMSLVLIFALLTPALAPVAGGRAAPLDALGAVALVGGMFAGAMGWWVGLSAAVAALRRRLSPAVMPYVNGIAGAVLAVYGMLALAHALPR